MKKLFGIFGLLAVLISVFVVTQAPQPTSAASIYEKRVHAMAIDYPNNRTNIYLLNPSTGELTHKKTINNFIGKAISNTHGYNSATDRGHYSLRVLGQNKSNNKLQVKDFDADLYYAETNSLELPSDFQGLDFKGNIGIVLGDYLAVNPWNNNEQYSVTVGNRIDQSGQSEYVFSKAALTGDKLPSGLEQSSNSFFKDNKIFFIRAQYSSTPEAINISLASSDNVNGLNNKSCAAQLDHDGGRYCSVWSSGWFNADFGTDLYRINAVYQGNTRSGDATRLISYSNSSWAGTKYVAGFASERNIFHRSISKENGVQKHGSTSLESDDGLTSTSSGKYIDGSDDNKLKNFQPELNSETFIAAAKYNTLYSSDTGPFNREVFVSKNKNSGQHYLRSSQTGRYGAQYSLESPYTTIDDIAYSKQQDALVVTGRFWGSDKTYINKINLNHENKTATYSSLGEVNANINAGLAQRADGEVEVYKDGKIYRLDLPKNGSPSLVKLRDVNTTGTDGKQVKSCSTFTAYNNWYYCTVNSNRTYGNAATDDYYRISPLNNYKPEYLGTDKSLYDIW